MGVSHRSAPVSVLERLTVGIETADGPLAGLRPGGSVAEGSVPAVGEAVLLATCNRVEIYAETEGFHAGVDAITDVFARLSGLSLDALAGHLYVHWEGQAVLHLFQVACGLDSMVVGESQILGQLRRAYGAARGDKATGRVLHELFQTALKVGKRAHAETGIDAAGQSLVSVGLAHAAAAVGPLEGRSAVVVGAGSMGALAGATLRRLGVGELMVANRSSANAARLATSLAGRGVALHDLEDALVDADVLVSSTGATGIMVPADLVERVMKSRRGRPLALVDLALPRDIDPSVRSLPGVTLIDLTSLQDVLAATETAADVEAVRLIVTEEVGSFLASQRASRVAPTVVALRQRAEELVAAELDRLAGRLPDLDARSRAEVDLTVRRVVDKLLHTPTVRVKELAEEPGGVSYAEALRELFELDRNAPAAVAQTSLALEEEGA